MTEPEDFTARGARHVPERRMNGDTGRRGLARSVQIGISLAVVSLAALFLIAPSHEGGASSETTPSEGSRADSLLYAATFDAAWSRIRDTHYSPDLNGVDWEGVRAELRPRAVSSTSDAEFRAVVREMLSRLGESHFVLIADDGASVLGEASGEGDPGFEVRWVDEALLLVSVHEGGAAQRAGVHPGWILMEIGGVPVDSLLAQVLRSGLPGESDRLIHQWLPVLVRNRAMGEAGTEVHLHLLDAEGASRQMTLRREPPRSPVTRIGTLPPIRAETRQRIEELPGGLRVGVLSWSAWVPATVNPIANAIDAFRPLDGVILDLRGNPGGLGALAMGVGGHFLNGGESLGTMTMRDATLRFVTNPQRVNPGGERVEPYSGPLAILLDPLSGSTSEIFSAGMQALGRARIFGERSAGQALPALITPLPNGDRLLHAVADFVAPNGERLEGAGVVPDVEVHLEREALLQGRDPMVAAALDWIRMQN